MNKTILLIILCLFSVISSFAQTYSGGSGTESDPYLISSKADMEALATAVNGGNTYSGRYFLLMQNLTEITTIIGNSESRYFSGNFDGGGCVVTANINMTNSYVGVFGYILDATIKNLGVEGSITRKSDTKKSYAGGICGYMNSGNIANCYNESNVSSNSGSGSDNPHAGGICGYNRSGSIGNCYNTGNVASFSYSIPARSSYAGGICGFSSGSISNCFAANVRITAATASYVGRIAGSDSGTITNCVASSLILINGSTVSSQDASSKNGRDIIDYNSRILDSFIDNKFQISDHLFLSMARLNNLTYGDNIDLNIINREFDFIVSYQLSNDCMEITENNLAIKKAGDINIGIIYNHNLALSDTIVINITINKKQLIIRADTLSINYGDALEYTCQYKGFVNNETETVLTKLPSFSCSGTSQSNVGSYTITPSGAEAENYSFTYKTGLLNILKRDLRVIPDNLSRLYGDNNPTLTLSYDGFVNGNTASNISTKPTTITTATKNSNVGDYDITCSGGNATNYNLIYEKGILKITKAPLTATVGNTSRIYGAENPTFSIASYSGFKNSETRSVILTEPTMFCNATKASPVGTYPITASGGNALNYEITQYNAGMLTINKAPVMVTADAISMTYGEIPQFTCKYEGFVNGESENVLTKKPVYNCLGTSLSNVGSYAIYPSGAEAENYSFTYKNGLLNILKRDLRVIPDNLSRLYGDNNPTLTLSYVGFVNGNTASNIYSPTASTIATKYSDIGNYDITCSGGSATNYNFIYEKGKLTINKAPLSIVANNASRYWGNENPIFTYSCTGLKNGETKSILTQEPQLSCAAIRLSPSGTYTIVINGGTASNYDITHVNGTLTINKSLQPAIIKFDLTNPNVVSDMQNTLKLSIENEDPIIAFSIDITFPSFVSVDLDKVGLSNRCSKNVHILNAVQVSSNPNKYRFMIYSPSNRQITGNEGELITIPLLYDWKTAPSKYANYTISSSGTSAVFYISEIDKPEKSINSASTTFYIHEMGDVNINGTITISDIVAEVDYILGKNPKPFLFEAGDMNKNNAITILDLTQLVNVVLTRGSAYYSVLRSSNSDYELSFSNLSLDYSKGDLTGNLILSMKNKLPVIALNWDLVLPEGVTIDDENLEFIGSRASRNTHVIAINKFEDENKYRFVIYSTQNKAISGTDGEFLSIPIKISEQTALGNFPITAIAPNLIYIDGDEQKETSTSSIEGILSIGTNGMGIDNLNIGKIEIYPNPVKQYLFIRSESAIEKVEIYNQSGVCVLSNENFIEKLDVSHLSDGFYFVRIFIDGSPVTKKIIIKK